MNMIAMLRNKESSKAVNSTTLDFRNLMQNYVIVRWMKFNKAAK